MLLCSVIALAAIAPAAWQALVLMSISYAAAAFTIVSIWCLPADVVDSSTVATLGSMQNFFSNIGSAPSPIVIGALYGATERAVELAQAGGPDAVTLRDVQRAVGVSHTADYQHYADRHALLAAVQQYGLGALGDAMLAAVAEVPNRGPRRRRALARLRATGAAYLNFAQTEPGLFRTAFSADVAAPADGEDAGLGARHPFEILTGCIDDLVTVGVLAPERRDGLAEAAWSAVHGLATLLLDGPLASAGAARQQLVIERLLDVVEDGIH